MFTVVKNPTFRCPATIHVPTDDGVTTQTLTVRFRLFEAVEEPGPDVDFLRHVIVSLEDLVDESDAPVPYCDEVRDQLLKRGYVRKGLIQAYFNTVNGAEATARGN